MMANRVVTTGPDKQLLAAASMAETALPLNILGFLAATALTQFLHAAATATRATLNRIRLDRTHIVGSIDPVNPVTTFKVEQIHGR